MKKAIAKPRRALSRLEGAPPFILAVQDYRDLPVPNRYTVFFGWPVWKPERPHMIPYIEIGAPEPGLVKVTSDPVDRQGMGDLIDWLDLPNELKLQVLDIACASPVLMKPVVMVSPMWQSNCEGVPRWMLPLTHGYGYYGPPEGFRTQGDVRDYCRENGIVLVDYNDPFRALYRRWWEMRHCILPEPPGARLKKEHRHEPS